MAKEPREYSTDHHQIINTTMITSVIIIIINSFIDTSASHLLEDDAIAGLLLQQTNSQTQSNLPYNTAPTFPTLIMLVHPYCQRLNQLKEHATIQVFLVLHYLKVCVCVCVCVQCFHACAYMGFI